MIFFKNLNSFEEEMINNHVELMNATPLRLLIDSERFYFYFANYHDETFKRNLFNLECYTNTEHLNFCHYIFNYESLQLFPSKYLFNSPEHNLTLKIISERQKPLLGYVRQFNNKIILNEIDNILYIFTKYYQKHNIKIIAEINNDNTISFVTPSQSFPFKILLAASDFIRSNYNRVDFFTSFIFIKLHIFFKCFLRFKSSLHRNPNNTNVENTMFYQKPTFNFNFETFILGYSSSITYKYIRQNEENHFKKFKVIGQLTNKQIKFKNEGLPEGRIYYEAYQRFSNINFFQHCDIKYINAYKFNSNFNLIEENLFQ